MDKIFGIQTSSKLHIIRREEVDWSVKRVNRWAGMSDYLVKGSNWAEIRLSQSGPAFSKWVPHGSWSLKP